VPSKFLKAPAGPLRPKHPGNGNIFGGFSDLIDLVDINDTDLGFGDIVLASAKPQNDVSTSSPHSGLCKRRRVTMAKGTFKIFASVRAKSVLRNRSGRSKAR